MKRFRNILFFADGALQPGSALQRAVTLAETNDARLTVIDVIDAQEPAPQIESRLGSDLNTILREYRRQALEAMVQPFNTPDTVIYTHVLSGTPFIEVIRSVLGNGYDLLIKAARPPDGLSERVFGSTDMHLMRKCPCPVWIDRPTTAMPYRRILAAVDPVDGHSAGCARLVMDLATSLARRESAELSVVHAWQLYGESMLRSGRGRVSPQELDRLMTHTHSRHRDGLASLLEPYGLDPDNPQVLLLKGNPAAMIHGQAKALDVDLVVMGTVGRVGVPGLFIGNTAEEVLQATSAAVLVVKPAGFVSPVTSRPVA